MPKMITCVIDSVRVSLTNQQRVVVLREKDAERYLPIWIGLYEAEAITIALQKIEVARPQTHDLLRSMMQTMEGRLLQVEITALRDDVFYASLVVDQNGQRKDIDCRPSDALALAARSSVPILVEEEVLAAAGIEPEEDASEMEGEIDTESEDLTVFEDFLENLDTDLGEGDEPGVDKPEAGSPV